MSNTTTNESMQSKPITNDTGTSSTSTVDDIFCAFSLDSNPLFELELSILLLINGRGSWGLCCFHFLQLKWAFIIVATIRYGGCDDARNYKNCGNTKTELWEQTY